MDNGKKLWDNAKQIAVTTASTCRSLMDRASGIEAARRITVFHDDIETLSSALVTRVCALESRSDRSSADHETRLRAIESRGRLQMALSLAALIASLVTLLLHFWSIA